MVLDLKDNLFVEIWFLNLGFNCLIYKVDIFNVVKCFLEVVLDLEDKIYKI